MSSIDLWLEPLRAYPRWVVMTSFATMTGTFMWIVAKMLKWSLYVTTLILFAVATGLFALWLWG